MPMLISMLLTLGIIYLFYRTADRLGAKAFHWGLAGALVYQIPAWAWKLLVSIPYLNSLRGTSAKTTVSAFLIGHSWILIGAVCAVLVYRFMLLKTNVREN